MHSCVSIILSAVLLNLWIVIQILSDMIWFILETKSTLRNIIRSFLCAFGPLLEDFLTYVVDKKAGGGMGDLDVLPAILVCYIPFIPDSYKNEEQKPVVCSQKFPSGTSGPDNLNQVSLFFLLSLSFPLKSSFQ